MLSTTMSVLYTPVEMGYPVKSEHWCEARDADPVCLSIFQRHYSYRSYQDGRPRRKFIGPGEYMALVSLEGDALFVWRKFISDDGQQGINCAVFRNEGPVLSSVLIREAMELARGRWPGERLYTYVNPRKIRSVNPGCCFQKAGWKACGMTKWRKLLILEAKP